MKRARAFQRRYHIRLDLPLAELKVLLGDDDGLLDQIGTELLSCSCCGLHPGPGVDVDIYIDDDSCLYMAHTCPLCQQGEASSFIDTSDLPDWQHILRNLLRQQFGMNSWGDE
ncbi:MAG: hypothetical protein ACK417_09710 [Bacteroidia bacterium]